MIFCDNVGTTYFCGNPVFHSHMKHITINFHFVRDQVQKGAVQVRYMNSEDQLVDALTKPLSRQRFHHLHNKIGV